MNHRFQKWINLQKMFSKPKTTLITSRQYTLQSIRIIFHAAMVTNYNKDNQMKSPSLLSGPKIRKAYFEASNRKMQTI